jgi:hypothetical protein
MAVLLGVLLAVDPAVGAVGVVELGGVAGRAGAAPAGADLASLVTTPVSLTPVGGWRSSCCRHYSPS